jgi:hypothetical protein
MGKFKETLKDEIKEEVGDLIYEKAKEEIKLKVKSRYRTILNRVFNIFGFRKTKRQQIQVVTAEITQNESVAMSNSLIGIIELFTVNYAKSAFDIAGSVISKPSHGKSKKNNSEL